MAAVSRTPARTLAAAGLAVALAFSAPALSADAVALLAAVDALAGPPTCC